MYSNIAIKPVNDNGLDKATDVQSANMNTGNPNWYLAMAKAWGNALDTEGQKLVDASLALSDDATVGDTIMVSAQAHKLSFMAQAASSTSNSIGQALETIAKKQ